MMIRSTSVKELVKSEDGYTLTELLIASVIGLIIIIAAGGLLVAGIHTQTTVGSTAAVTRTSTQVYNALTAGIRNSIAISVTTVNTNDQIVRAKTLFVNSSGTQTWTCRAWYYSSTNQKIYASNTSATTLVATPTAAQLATWHVLGTSVTKTSATTPVFGGGTSGLTVAYTTTSGAVQQGSYVSEVVPFPVPTPTVAPGSTLTCT
jgi:prepilin-type N-terminal cleavage/methylation domain-containing protein